jgi:hypothetical protein
VNERTRLLENPGFGQVFTYRDTICPAIRHEVDGDPLTTSLVRCLQQLVDFPQFTTRSRFVALAAESHKDRETPRVHSIAFSTSFLVYVCGTGPPYRPGRALRAMLIPDASPGTQYQFSGPCSFSSRSVGVGAAPHLLAPGAHAGTLPINSAQNYVLSTTVEN